MPQTDDLDNRILGFLRKNPCVTKLQLARQLKIHRNTCTQRVKKLTKLGFIVGRGLVLDPRRAQQLTRYLLLKTVPDRKKRTAVEKLLADSPIVSAFEIIAGEYTYMILISDEGQPGALIDLIDGLSDIHSAIETLTCDIVPRRVAHR